MKVEQEYRFQLFRGLGLHKIDPAWAVRGAVDVYQYKSDIKSARLGKSGGAIFRRICDLNDGIMVRRSGFCCEPLSSLSASLIDEGLTE